MRSVRNESSIDRALRIVGGFGAMSLLFTLSRPPLETKLGLVGLIPLITGITGYCPTYRLFDIDTRKSHLRGQELRQ